MSAEIRIGIEHRGGDGDTCYLGCEFEFLTWKYPVPLKRSYAIYHLHNTATKAQANEFIIVINLSMK